VTTYKQLTDTVEAAVIESAWFKGYTNDAERQICKELKGLWDKIVSTLDPQKKGIPLVCEVQQAPEDPRKGRVIGKHVFVSSDEDNGFAHGFDVTLRVGALAEKTSFDLLAVPGNNNGLLWYIRVDGKRLFKEAHCSGPVPIEFNKEKFANIVIENLSSKLVKKARS